MVPKRVTVDVTRISYNETHVRWPHIPVVTFVRGSLMDTRTATGAEVQSWPQGMSAITLFVEDLEATKQFYHTTFEVPILFEANDVVMCKVGPTYIKLYKPRRQMSCTRLRPWRVVRLALALY